MSINAAGFFNPYSTTVSKLNLLMPPALLRHFGRDLDMDLDRDLDFDLDLDLDLDFDLDRDLDLDA